MTKRVFQCATLCVFALLLNQAMAQMQPGTNLPKVLWLYHEDVKPAKDNAHERVEHGFAQVWAKAKVSPYLGMNSLTSTAETVFMSGYDSLGAFETDFQTFNKAFNGPMQTELQSLERQESEMVSGVRSTVAVLKDDLSYMTDRWHTILPQSRYLEIVTMRVGPGKDSDFASVAKFYREAFQKGDYQQPFAIYRVLFGAPSATYLVVLPVKSLKSLDEMLVTEPRLLAAMGEENMQHTMKMIGDTLLYDESNLYALNPKISNVSTEFASADPEFWTPQPASMAMQKTGKTSNQMNVREKKAGK